MINEVWNIKTAYGSYTTKVFNNATQKQVDAYYDKIVSNGSKLIGAHPIVNKAN